jgi:adenine phosphoribosyltransferase
MRVTALDVDSYREELLRRWRWVDGHADVLGLFTDGRFLRAAALALAAPFADERVDKVAGIEARGFVLGAAVALELQAGFVAMRKPGSVHPGPKLQRKSLPDWRGRRVELVVQRNAVAAGERVLVVDDWAETGSQALVARQLLEEVGGVYVGLSLIVDQLAEERRSRLAPVASVVDAADLPPSG